MHHGQNGFTANGYFKQEEEEWLRRRKLARVRLLLKWIETLMVLFENTVQNMQNKLVSFTGLLDWRTESAFADFREHLNEVLWDTLVSYAINGRQVMYQQVLLYLYGNISARPNYMFYQAKYVQLAALDSAPEAIMGGSTVQSLARFSPPLIGAYSTASQAPTWNSSI